MYGKNINLFKLKKYSVIHMFSVKFCLGTLSVNVFKRKPFTP